VSNPTNLVSQFDSDLAYTDQSGAGVWTGVQPIRYDDGLWVEEATVNLCRNPSFESGTTTWSANTGTLSQDTGTAYVGSASLLTTRSGATGNLGPFFTTSNSTIAEGDYVAVTLAAKADYAPTTCVLECYWRTDASGALGSAATTQFALTADFVERTHVFGPAPATTGKAIIGLTDQSNGTIGEKLWIDAVQVENKGYATSYADYTMGAGYGGSLGNSSTRAASSASISPSGIFDTYLGAIVFVATPTIETGAEEIWGELGEKLAGADHIRWGRDSTKHPFVEWSGNDSAYTRVTLTATVDAGDEHFYSIEWHVSDADFRLYLDDDPSENDTIPSPQEDYGAGPLKLQATAGGVIYGGLAICSERLTNDQRARLKVVMENRGNIETALDSKRGRYGFFQVRPKVE
jgi:hypothetical protein